jgi:hypothetical protein
MNNNQATKTCRIDTGDFVGSALTGPEWTPYAQRIADHYPVQLLWYLTKQQTLVVADPRNLQAPVTQTIRPQLYDVLILGMSALIVGEALLDNGNYIYLQITDLETGIPWVAPNMIGYAPVPAFAGINADPSTGTFFPMPVLKLPEAYFLPKGTRLKLDWFPIQETDGDPVNLNVRLTMIGVQLINHAPGFKAPTHVTMPNGDTIPVGSRLPWFGCVPFGQRDIILGQRILQDFSLQDDEQALQFLPPLECNLELHDAYANFLAQTVRPAAKVNLKLKLNDMRDNGDWTPEFSPSPAIFGNEEQVYPARPFAKPHLVRKGHRPALVMFNNSGAGALNRGTVTLRGVRLCEY